MPKQIAFLTRQKTAILPLCTLLAFTLHYSVQQRVTRTLPTETRYRCNQIKFTQISRRVGFVESNWGLCGTQWDHCGKKERILCFLFHGQKGNCFISFCFGSVPPRLSLFAVTPIWGIVCQICCGVYLNG